jgi:hypothetical protein
MDNGAIVAVISLLLGGGGTAGIGLFIKMLRDHRKGKIEDDGTIIERLNAEAKDLVAARKHAERERDEEHRQKMEWMTQALAYRMQVATATPPIKPNDFPELWIRPTPVIEQ